MSRDINLGKFWKDKQSEKSIWNRKEYFIREKTIIAKVYDESLEENKEEITVLKENVEPKEQISESFKQEEMILEENSLTKENNFVEEKTTYLETDNLTLEKNEEEIKNKKVKKVKLFVQRDMVKTSYFLPIIFLIIFIIYLIFTWILFDAGGNVKLFTYISGADKPSQFALLGFHYSKWLTTFFISVNNGTSATEASYLLNLSNSATNGTTIFAFFLFILFIALLATTVFLMIWKIIPLIKNSFTYGIVAIAITALIILFTILLITAAPSSKLSYAEVNKVVSEGQNEPTIDNNGKWLGYFLMSLLIISSGFGIYIFKMGQSNPKLAA
ncbi:hypothetical protein MM26B8_01420 [Mycoplasmopsis meleagridis]|uniref:Uncharacterized protein n=1 Tax=Mycoplasmopsis meleagridis ATCC 25294 TaxID=1264554 RepID=A0A0F5H139_9BACT|nr:hypothetical protein [Mycoplasmopsis meleagridis]KKB26928.1 hypothetical protein MMELEA_03780 [Mycoplasmopsis meleagridis ATCC 25294]OAD18517.1 hypothetical protein MM26B8_01420 [Mycoplasmopsis meleagridis]VEU77614.1 Uncharacterised protein [Mycoplasmopsis meleagridis]